MNFITTLHQMNINIAHNVMKTETYFQRQFLIPQTYLFVQKGSWIVRRDNLRFVSLLLHVNSTSFYDENMMSFCVLLFIVTEVLRTNKQAKFFLQGTLISCIRISVSIFSICNCRFHLYVHATKCYMNNLDSMEEMSV